LGELAFLNRRCRRINADGRRLMKASSHLRTKLLQKSLLAERIICLGGVRSLFLGDLAFFEPQMQADQRGWTQIDERDLALTD